jgi:flagellar biogenesis protein FliO
MLSHTGTLGQYLGLFVLYTMLAIGLIYGAYWVLRKRGGILPKTAQKPEGPLPTPLLIESTLALEPRKTLYVIKAGHERFLVASTLEQTQLLSKLEAEPAAEVSFAAVEAPAGEPQVALPWFATPPDAKPTPELPSSKVGFGARFLQSLQWLAASRIKV